MDTHRFRLRLIELFVVLIVVGAGVALLISSLPAMREAARKRSCADNMRILGIALRQYHEAQQVLPPAAIQPRADAVWELFSPNANIESATVSHVNWMVLLLPFVDEQVLADKFDESSPISDPVNLKARTTEFTLMKCPADDYNRPDNRYVCTLIDGNQAAYSRGNYAINVGSSNIEDAPGSPSNPQPAGVVRILDGDMERWWGEGIAGFNKSFSTDEFARGLSSIVALDEIRAGIAQYDSRGVWALGQIGASATYAHGLYGDACQPNCTWWRSDDTLGCAQLHTALGVKKIDQECMQCCPDTSKPIQATARSKHLGGVNVLMMDGVVRFVVEEVDTNIWHVIHSRRLCGKVPLDQLTIPSENGIAFNTSLTDAAHVNNSLPDNTSASLSPHTPPNPVTNSIGMQLIEIPAGDFIMGAPDKKGRVQVKEVPAHWVRILKRFLIGVHEVTQNQYHQVMDDNPSWHSPTGEGKEDITDSDTRSYPVEQVSWNNAMEFCRKLSSMPSEQSAKRTYRLPTEAEWEYASRCGGREMRFSDESGKSKTWPITPVGAKTPNAFGVHDMRGNVWEWTADWYDRNYYKNSPLNDPQGPSSGVIRMVRGTDWIFTNLQCKLNQHSFAPTEKSRFIGFRVVCENKSD